MSGATCCAVDIRGWRSLHQWERPLTIGHGTAAGEKLTAYLEPLGDMDVLWEI